MHVVFHEDRDDPLGCEWWPLCDPTHDLHGEFVPKSTPLTCRRCARALGVDAASPERNAMSDVQEFLDNSRGSRYPAAKFDKVGDSAVGTIVGKPKVVDTQYGPRVLVDLENPNLADGGVTVWIKPGTMGQAVAEAVGKQGMVEGGKLAIVFTEERDTGKPSPLKVFEAQYDPPRSAVDVASVFDGLGEG